MKTCWLQSGKLQKRNKEAAMLDDLKRILGIAPEDTDLDDKLNWIISSVRSRLKLLLGGTDPPEEMNYIIVEVAVVRFNRIGSEGTAAIR